MKLTDKITKTVMRHYRDEIVLPNFYLGVNECDVLVLRDSGYSYEFEVKITRQDYFADFKKAGKHVKIQQGLCVPNKFYFVVPEGMIKPEEVPPYAGLFYFTETEGRWNTGAPYMIHKITEIKAAKLLHKEHRLKLASIAKSCYYREKNIREKLSRVQSERKAQAERQKQIDDLSDKVEAYSIRLMKYEAHRHFEIYKHREVYKKYFPDNLET